jgi:Secretion system C-terminal sorting domain
MKTNTFIKTFIIGLSMISFKISNAQLLYSNGNLNTGTYLNNGTACTPGKTWSELQSKGNIANITLGFGTNNNIQLADDFMVPNGQTWNITSIDVFVMYQYNLTPVPADFDNLFVEIYNVDPATSGAIPIFGNMTTNVVNLSNSGTENLLRTRNTSYPSGPITYDFEILKLKASISTTLPSGQYWIVYKCYETGFPNSTVISSPSVIVNNSRGLPTANAKTKYGGVWSPLLDTGFPSSAADVQQELPFKVNGTISNNVSNDACLSANNIFTFPYNFVEGNGANTTNNNGFINSCSVGMNDGEWFKFTGNGNNITITTSNIDSNYDTAIGVYSGNCGALVCEGLMDNYYDGVGETITIPNTVLGVTYFINIGHYSSSSDLLEGNFTINVIQTPFNDECTNAKFAEFLPFSYNQAWGDTATNNNGFISNCAGGMNDGVWFKFMGTGGNTFIDLPVTQYNYDAELAVYSGTCGNFACVGSSDVAGVGGEELVTFYSNEGEMYYVNVGHYSGSLDFPEGNFQITIGGFLPNDTCYGAKLITSNNFIFNENAGGLATQTSFLDDCGSEFGSNDGEWFKVVSSGGNIAINVFNNLTYNTKISVYKGADCNTLLCDGIANNAGIGGAESYTITNSVAGTTYYICVGNASQNNDLPEGPFQIQVSGAVLANEIFDTTKLKVYPNPVSNILNIENGEQMTKISVYNLLGQELISKKMNDFRSEIEVSNLSSGTYFVKINAEKGEQVIKIIKK